MVNRSIRPRISTFDNLELAFPQQVKLNNGITCWIVDGGEDEMVRTYVYFGGGSMMESKPAQSLLTALMLLEGHQGSTASQVAEKFDYYGARKSADSYDFNTEVVLTSLNDNFEQTMQLLFNCIKNPLFPQEEFEVLKRRLIGNIQILDQRVKYIASSEMKRLYYGDNHPLGHKITVDDIISLTRDDLVSFHNTYYNPSNCKLIIAGRVTNEILQQVNNTIGSWHNDNCLCPTAQWHTNPSSEMLTIVDKPGAMQSGIRMRIQAISRKHPDYIPLRILIMAFGGYFGSRLMSNIREDKGYTYGINASLLGTHYDGCIDISTECATCHTINVINEVKAEMKLLRNTLIPEDELETVKQHMYSALAKTHDTPFNIAGYVSSTILFGVYPQYHNDHIKCLDAITPQQLRDIACKYLVEDKLRIVIAGDQSEIKKLL